MRTKNLLSALAVASLVAACTNEEFVVNETATTTTIEGAKLLGTGLSLNIGGTDADTRITDGQFDSNDKAGLAWVASADGGDQSTVKLSDTDDTQIEYNHMYMFNGGKGDDSWYSRSDIYQGWHFAYFPFMYQSVKAPIQFDVNSKVMSQEYKSDMRNGLLLSAAWKLTEKYIDKEHGALIGVEFPLRRMVNVLAPQLNISEDFRNDELLSGLGVNSVTINTDYQLFKNTVKIVPSKLPEAKFDDKGDFDRAATVNQFSNDLYGDDKALVQSGDAKSVTTTIAEDFMALDKEKQLTRVFLAPIPSDNYLTKNETAFESATTAMSITVNTDQGHFTVKYDDPKLTGEEKSMNNKAIKKLYSILTGIEDVENNPYKDDFTKITYEKDENGKIINVTNGEALLDIYLGLENFTADYIISNYKEWLDACALADALKETNVTFQLDGNVEFPAGEMAMPKTAKVTVKKYDQATVTPNMIFSAETTWANNINENIAGVVVKVANSGVLDFNGVLSYATVLNEGTINAGPLASLAKNGKNAYLNNENGRIVVEYGAYIYAADKKEGIIAYVIEDGDDKEIISKANTLMNPENTLGNANVNTLIIRKTTLDINAESVGATEGDRYNGGVEKESLTSLDGINIELEGGSIIYDKRTAPETNANTKVGSLTAVEGTNTTTDIEVIDNKLIVKGRNTVLNVESITEDKTPLTLTDGTITNEGTLNADTNINVLDVFNKNKINVAKGQVITYWGKFEQAEEGGYTGKIEKGLSR